MSRTSIYATVQKPEAVATTLASAASAGHVVFHVRRHDGSLRRMSYLRPRTADRRVAERVKAMRAKNVQMSEIAKKLHVSVPTVRRMINNLELSEHIENGDMNYVLELFEPGTPRTRKG